MTIDTSKWEEFRLGDEKYFDVKRGESKYLKNMSPGDFPYISTTRTNNGIKAYVSECNRKGSLITLAYDGSIGACFYQDEPFFASEKIVTIDTVQHPMSRELAFFLIPIIKLEAEMYSYGGRKWTVNKQLKNTRIKLPATADGEPDYEWMEEYIRGVRYDISTLPDYFLSEGYEKACWYMDNIDRQRFENEYAGRASESGIKLTDRHMEYFALKDLIDEPYIAESYDKKDLLSSDTEDYVNYVTRTSQNNGISDYVVDNNYMGLEKGNAIIIGDTTATCFYQAEDFIAGEHIIVLRAPWFNLYTCMFLISVINLEKFRYAWGARAFIKEAVKNTVVKLPVDNTGNPDYRFMEDYIKSLPFSCNLE